MGMEFTNLHKNPETRELIVNSDINTGNFNIIANDIMANNITVNNLTSNSITNTGDISTDTLTANSIVGALTGIHYGEQVHVVNCTPSTKVFYDYDFYVSGDSNIHTERDVILPFSPSTYYSGKINVWRNKNWGAGNIVVKLFCIRNSEYGGNISISHTFAAGVEDLQEITIPTGTISIIVQYNISSNSNGNILIGFTNDYLPLPPQ